MRKGRGRQRRRAAAIVAAIGLLGLVVGSFSVGVFVGLRWSYVSAAMSTLLARRPAPESR